LRETGWRQGRRVWYLDGGGGCRGVEVVGEGGGEAHRGQYGDPERCHRVGAVPKGVHPVAAPLPLLPCRSSRDRRPPLPLLLLLLPPVAAAPATSLQFPSLCLRFLGKCLRKREKLARADPPCWAGTRPSVRAASLTWHALIGRRTSRRGAQPVRTQEAGCTWANNTWANKWAYSGPFVRVDP